MSLHIKTPALPFLGFPFRTRDDDAPFSRVAYLYLITSPGFGQEDLCALQSYTIPSPLTVCLPSSPQAARCARYESRLPFYPSRLRLPFGNTNPSQTLDHPELTLSVNLQPRSSHTLAANPVVTTPVKLRGTIQSKISCKACSIQGSKRVIRFFNIWGTTLGSDNPMRLMSVVSC